MTDPMVTTWLAGLTAVAAMNLALAAVTMIGLMRVSNGLAGVIEMWRDVRAVQTQAGHMLNLKDQAVMFLEWLMATGQTGDLPWSDVVILHAKWCAMQRLPEAQRLSPNYLSVRFQDLGIRQREVRDATRKYKMVTVPDAGDAAAHALDPLTKPVPLAAAA
ncbi:MAG: hypothetical protein AAFQ35_07355 [Pseudomonadota bacterium]